MRGGRRTDSCAGTLGVFRADNHDDILFVADDQAGFGYFRNFGKTRRQGIEVGIAGRVGDVRLRRATTRTSTRRIQSTETINGAGNSSNDGPAPGFRRQHRRSHAGDRIPLIPQHLFKAYADWDITPEVSLNLDLLAASGFYARGNENNQHEPDGVYYLGPGKTPGYAVLNLGGAWRPSRGLQLFSQVNNLFDTQYYTAAQLGRDGLHRQRHVHRPTVRRSGHRRRAPARARDVLRARRAANGVDRRELCVQQTGPLIQPAAGDFEATKQVSLRRARMSVLCR